MFEMTRPLTLPGFNWRTLLFVTGLGDLIVLLGMAVMNRDTLALALSGIILLGLGLVYCGRPILGAIVLAGVFADISLYTVAGTVTNIVKGMGLQATILPAMIAVVSVAGFITAVASVLARHKPQAGRRAAPLVGQAAVGCYLLLLGAALVTGRGGQPVTLPSDIELTTTNMAYSQSELATEHGEVTLLLANEDLFWHTFTVDTLGVDLKVPKDGWQQVTFAAASGTYEFYCSIPGHALLGMKGTLVVQ